MPKKKSKFGLGLLAVLFLLVSAAAPAGSSSTGDTATGDVAAGDTTSGDTAFGDSVTGDTQAGDNVAGDTAAGDTTTGDTAAGDSVTGEYPAGATLTGGTAGGESAAGDSVTGAGADGDTVGVEAAAGETVAAPEWRRFANEPNHFSLELPTVWRELSGIPNLDFVAAGSLEGSDDKFIENLTVATAPNSPPRTIDDFIELYLRYLPETVKGYEFIEQTNLRVDGRASRQLVFMLDLEGEKVQVMQTIFIKGDKVFFLTYTDSPDTFGGRKADFERSAGSLKFD